MADQADVLEERQNLDACLVQLGPLVQASLDSLDSMSKEAMMIASKAAEIDTNADFKVKQNQPIWVPVKIPEGEHTTRCLMCNRTCHRRCKIAGNQKSRCCMIQDGFCTAGNCTCPTKHHVDHDEELVRKDNYVTVLISAKKTAWEEAHGKKATSENMIYQLIDDYNATQKAIMQNIETMRLSKIRLCEIALRPSSLNACEHLDILIQGEQADSKPGWNERCKQLNDLKRRLKVGEDVAKGQNPMEEVLRKYLEDRDTNMEVYMQNLVKIEVKSEAQLLQEARAAKKIPRALPPVPGAELRQEKQACPSCEGWVGSIKGVFRTCPDCKGTGKK